MSATGIGAAVRRKEDQRFITGKGHYTDDINRPGQTYAYFVRSPHAHATIKSIDSKQASSMPGVLAVLNGAELAADKIGNLICGWMIHSKDGSPMKMAPHPALASSKVCHVGDPVAVVIAESRQAAKNAAELLEIDYSDIPAVANLADAVAAGAPEVHDGVAGNICYDWQIGDPAVVSKLKDAVTALEAKGLTSEEIESRWKQLISRLRTEVGGFSALPSADPGRSDAAFCLFLHSLAIRTMRFSPSWPKSVATRLGLPAAEGAE